MEKLKFEFPEKITVREENLPRAPIKNIHIAISVMPIMIAFPIMVFFFTFLRTFLIPFLIGAFVATFALYQYFRFHVDNETNYDPKVKITKKYITPAESLSFENTGVYHTVFSSPLVEKHFAWNGIEEIVIGGVFERMDGIYFNKQKFDLKNFIIQKEPYVNKGNEIIEFLRKNSPLQENVEQRWASGEQYPVYHFINK